MRSLGKLNLCSSILSRNTRSSSLPRESSCPANSGVALPISWVAATQQAKDLASSCVRLSIFIMRCLVPGESHLSHSSAATDPASVICCGRERPMLGVSSDPVFAQRDDVSAVAS